MVIPAEVGRSARTNAYEAANWLSKILPLVGSNLVSNLVADLLKETLIVASLEQLSSISAESKQSDECITGWREVVAVASVMWGLQRGVNLRSSED